jgi:AraC-like DNA-binding protein
MSRSDFDFESRMVPLLLAFAKARGLDVAPLIERFRLPADVLAQPPGKVTLTTAVSVLPALADTLAAQLSDPHVGLAIAEAVPRGAYGVGEFLIRSGPTLRSAFENTARFNAIMAPSQTFRFEESGDEAQLHHTATHTPGVLGRHLHEYSSAVLIKGLRAMTDEPVVRAWFIHPRPAAADLTRLAAALGTTNIEYGAATNGFALRRSALEQPVKGGDAALYAFLEEHALAALASRPKTDDLLDKLRHLIRDALKQGEPSIERVATRLHMSGRTLQRRLADLQTSFQEVLDAVRFDLARAYLKDNRLDVSQVAYLLGYSELRAFDRAFRRWANQSPSEWRAAAT